MGTNLGRSLVILVIVMRVWWSDGRIIVVARPPPNPKQDGMHFSFGGDRDHPFPPSAPPNPSSIPIQSKSRGMAGNYRAQASLCMIKAAIVTKHHEKAR